MNAIRIWWVILFFEAYLCILYVLKIYNCEPLSSLGQLMSLHKLSALGFGKFSQSFPLAIPIEIYLIYSVLRIGRANLTSSSFFNFNFGFIDQSGLRLI